MNFSAEDFNSIQLGTDVFSTLRVALFSECFQEFVHFCNMVTVSASLKGRQIIYSRIFLSMVHNGTIKTGNLKEDKLLLQRNNWNAQNDDFRTINVSYTKSANGLKSLSLHWGAFPREEILSLVLLLDVNQRGYICWNDICLLGEMIYDSFRRDAAHPIRAYKLLYKSIRQSLKNMYFSFLSSSVGKKVSQLVASSRENGFCPLQLFEEYIIYQSAKADIAAADSKPAIVAKFLNKLAHRLDEEINSLVRLPLSVRDDLSTTPSQMTASKSGRTRSRSGSEVDSSSLRYLRSASLLMVPDSLPPR